MDETWYTDLTSHEDDKKSNKKWGSPCLFWHHNADKYDYLGPFEKKPREAQKQTKRRYFFDDAWGIAQNLTLMYCFSTYAPEKCLLMPLFLLYAPK